MGRGARRPRLRPSSGSAREREAGRDAREREARLRAGTGRRGEGNGPGCWASWGKKKEKGEEKGVAQRREERGRLAWTGPRGKREGRKKGSRPS